MYFLPWKQAKFRKFDVFISDFQFFVFRTHFQHFKTCKCCYCSQFILRKSRSISKVTIFPFLLRGVWDFPVLSKCSQACFFWTQFSTRSISFFLRVDWNLLIEDFVFAFKKQHFCFYELMMGTYFSWNWSSIHVK